MIMLFGQMKKSLRQRMKVISLSWFVSKQKTMTSSVDISTMLLGMYNTLPRQFRMN